MTEQITPDALLNVLLLVATVFASLVGVGSLVSAVINFGKAVGLVKDGTAANWSAALNLLAFGGIVAFLLLNPNVQLYQVDNTLKSWAFVVTFLISYIPQLRWSAFVSDTLQNVPALKSTVGFSHNQKE